MSFSGKYLRINLNTGEILLQQVDPADVRRFLLGSGYAAMLSIIAGPPGR